MAQKLSFNFKIWRFIYCEIRFGIIWFGKWYRSFGIRLFGFYPLRSTTGCGRYCQNSCPCFTGWDKKCELKYLESLNGIFHPVRRWMMRHFIWWDSFSPLRWAKGKPRHLKLEKFNLSTTRMEHSFLRNSNFICKYPIHK